MQEFEIILTSPAMEVPDGYIAPEELQERIDELRKDFPDAANFELRSYIVNQAMHYKLAFKSNNPNNIKGPCNEQ